MWCLSIRSSQRGRSGQRALPRTRGNPDSPKAGSRTHGFPGHSGPGAQQHDPLCRRRSGRGWGEGAQLARAGARGVGVGTRRPGPLSRLRSPCPGSTAAGQRPRPRARAPGRPHPGTPGAARREARAGARGQAPMRTRAVVPVAAAASSGGGSGEGGTRRARSQPAVRCVVPALTLPAPGAGAALRPFTSHLLPFPSLPTAPRTCSQWRAHAQSSPGPAPARPLADASHTTERKGEVAGWAWSWGPHRGFGQPIPES